MQKLVGCCMEAHVNYSICQTITECKNSISRRCYVIFMCIVKLIDPKISRLLAHHVSHVVGDDDRDDGAERHPAGPPLCARR